MSKVLLKRLGALLMLIGVAGGIIGLYVFLILELRK